MPAVLHPSFVSQVVNHLPQWLVRSLDAWSYRVARRRARERQRRWLARTAAPQPAARTAYHLKPWRD
jgi:hypothetical protein